MPIQGLEQPEIIAIEPTLRLRKFDGKYDFALKWYQDEDVVYMVDGVRRAYDMDRLTRMYTYLNQAGELYFIEVLESGSFRPIGDVTFWQDDMPIVIGDPHYRGEGDRPKSSVRTGSARQGGTAATGSQGGKRKQCKGERFYG